MKAYFRSTTAGKFRGDLAKSSQESSVFVPQGVGCVAVVVNMYHTRLKTQTTKL
jgi:hypothetical protein